MPQPNILLIVTDQQRFDTLHVAGNPHIRTPHLNWLAESGVLFRRCYSDSPVCVTARATMITGRHYHNLGGYGWWGKPTAPDATRTLPGLLTRAGYQTRAVGKLHFTPARCAYGFEHAEILQDYYRYMAKHPHLGVPMDHGLGQNEMEPARSTVSESNSLTHWTVDRSINFLETRDETRPFFLHVGFAKPHPPLDPCENYWQMYAHADVPPPVYGDWSKTPETIPPGFLHPTWMLGGVDRFDPRLLQDMRRAYYACITQIDYNLGRLFARMTELALLDNTLILFTSDHGEMLGDHHMSAKIVYLEGSAHVPMIVRPPKEGFDATQRGSTSDALVCHADILSTGLNAAGVRLPEGQKTDGFDLLAFARGEAQRDTLIGECGEQHFVLQGTWKYTFTSLGAGELLFDLATDPMEQRNRQADPSCAATLERLRRVLVERLTRDKHPAVQNGRLVATRPAPTRRQCRAVSWPGFHTQHCLHDLLH